MKNRIFQKNILILFVTSSILALTLSGCSPAATPESDLTPVTVQLKWLHTSQFAGFYVADQKGFYSDEGLIVTFIQGGTNIDALKPVVDGTAQFGIASAIELLSLRATGAPVTAISTIFHRNPTVFFALSSTGITKPSDLIGKKIRAVSDQPLILHTMMANVDIPPEDYTEVTLPSDLALVLDGDVPVWGSYITSLAIIVKRAGYDINIIYPDDYGVHFYGDTIFTTDNFISSNPDVVLRFLRATLKGWIYAIENPGEVGTIVSKYNPKADIDLENTEMLASLPLVNTGEDHIGWMRAEIWAGMEQTMREQKVLTSPLDVKKVYTMQFLEEIYK